MLFVFFRIATIIAFVKTFFDPNEISPGKNDYEAIKDADIVNHGPWGCAGNFASWDKAYREGLVRQNCRIRIGGAGKTLLSF